MALSHTLVNVTLFPERPKARQPQSTINFSPPPLRNFHSSVLFAFQLYHYCQALEIQFTRGRPCKKDDNAHIEQKNWTHVRRLLGYQRYDSPTAREAPKDLYAHELRLFQNLFLPSMKLRRKVWVGSRLKRAYDPPQTPIQRVCASKQVIPAKVAQLQHWRSWHHICGAGAAISASAKRPKC